MVRVRPWFRGTVAARIIAINHGLSWSDMREIISHTSIKIIIQLFKLFLVDLVNSQQSIRTYIHQAGTTELVDTREFVPCSKISRSSCSLHWCRESIPLRATPMPERWHQPSIITYRRYLSPTSNAWNAGCQHVVSSHWGVASHQPVNRHIWLWCQSIYKFRGVEPVCYQWL